MTLSPEDIEALEAAGVIATPRKVGSRSTVYQITDPDAFKAWIAEHKASAND
jgi:hypothetical protein